MKYKTLDQLKKIGAQIGMLELKRKAGIYVSIYEILKLKKEFKILNKIYFFKGDEMYGKI